MIPFECNILNNKIKMTMFMTKPGAYKQMGLNVKNFHIFLNK
jgi:hypothetical protein